MNQIVIVQEYMQHFQVGDRVRIRKGARVSVQIGVKPGMSGVILPIREWDPRPWHEGNWDEPIYFVRFDGFSEHDIVEESALELEPSD